MTGRISSTDLVVTNEQVAQRFDLNIKAIEIKQNKSRGWIVEVFFIDTEATKLLTTTTDTQNPRIWKSLDSVINFIIESCYNARNIVVLINDTKIMVKH